MSFLFGKKSTAYDNLTIDEYQNQFSGDDHILVDVRTSSEFRQGRLPGAINIPLDQLSNRVGEIAKDRPVVVVCASGNRSQTGAQTLSQAGFSNVYNLKGGLMIWMMRGLEIEQ